MTAMNLDEYRKTPRAALLNKQAKDEYRQGLAMLSQAAVKAELLTGQDSWDTYLSYIQAFFDRTKILHGEFAGKLADPMLVDHLDILRAKISLAECTAMLKVLTSIIALPKDIVNNGIKAKTLIESMDEDEGDGGGTG